MRISDWSSDVCSSDLLPTHFCKQLAVIAHLGGSQLFGISGHQIAQFTQQRTALRRRKAGPVALGIGLMGSLDSRFHVGLIAAWPFCPRLAGVGVFRHKKLTEHGRASGRERGGQYV